jgi:hypothetical protein
VCGRGAESYDRKKAWSSINNSLLSVYSCLSPVISLRRAAPMKALFCGTKIRAVGFKFFCKPSKALIVQLTLFQAIDNLCKSFVSSAQCL